MKVGKLHEGESLEGLRQIRNRNFAVAHVGRADPLVHAGARQRRARRRHSKERSAVLLHRAVRTLAHAPEHHRDENHGFPQERNQGEKNHEGFKRVPGDQHRSRKLRRKEAAEADGRPE